MEAEKTNPVERLESVLAAIGPMAVAVSGGVDSMTLALVAHRRAPGECAMFHAVSPAVPGAATARVRDIAAREGWRLVLIDAGELADRRYRANPPDRCLYCKTNLYSTISRHSSDTMVSGANLDDLGDWRPGLGAARDHGVRHPYVEAGIDKATVRGIAAGLGFADLADLPAGPCLSSRVETGIRIEPHALAMIEAAERLITVAVKPATVRCRLRRSKVVIELDEDCLAALSPAGIKSLGDSIASIFADLGQSTAVHFAPYRMGSAFLRADGP
ncbi:MAG: adenine nucleotide alpha hydrolase [Alphaproteobacteria bacterium]|nr:adenine nucleotide alpha hydrolase [Alphaproteobacteria bacterium]